METRIVLIIPFQKLFNLDKTIKSTSELNLIVHITLPKEFLIMFSWSYDEMLGTYPLSYIY